MAAKRPPANSGGLPSVPYQFKDGTVFEESRLDHLTRSAREYRTLADDDKLDQGQRILLRMKAEHCEREARSIIEADAVRENQRETSRKAVEKKQLAQQPKRERLRADAVAMWKTNARLSTEAVAQRLASRPGASYKSRDYVADLIRDLKPKKRK